MNMGEFDYIDEQDPDENSYEESMLDKYGYLSVSDGEDMYISTIRCLPRTRKWIFEVEFQANLDYLLEEIEVCANYYVPE